MRVIFNEELKQVADDLDRMAQNVRKAIKGAGEALLNQDVEAAQTVIDGDIEIDALESSVIDQCVKLLAKQNPVATDLRVVVSTMRLASTFERMGDLARHVAEAARRTYPAAAIPESAQPVFAEMIDFLDNTADQLVAMLLCPKCSGNIFAAGNGASALVIKAQDGWHTVPAGGSFQGRRDFLSIANTARRSTSSSRKSSCKNGGIPLSGHTAASA